MIHPAGVGAAKQPGAREAKPACLRRSFLNAMVVVVVATPEKEEVHLKNAQM